MLARRSVDDLPMTCRWPAGDRRIYCHPMATGRQPSSHRRGACRSPSGHRPKIMSSAKKIRRSSNSHPAAAGRRPPPDLYDMVQGRKNPAICRCQKTGIGGKSGDHRKIYKACDVGIRKAKKEKCPPPPPPPPASPTLPPPPPLQHKTTPIEFGYPIIWSVELKHQFTHCIQLIHSLFKNIFSSNYSQQNMCLEFSKYPT